MVLVLSATASVAWAQQPAGPAVSKIDKGDTAWMLTSSALVLLMTTPGLALFYGGMVRGKNALATLMQSFIIMAVISIQWVLWGYSLAFGPDKGGIIGGLDWFGFNAGSALEANALAVSAFLATNTGAAAAALGWMFTEWMTRGKPTVLGAASGAVAGLVAITPASGYVGPVSSLMIGALAGVFCYSACNFKSKLGYDDSLDVVGVHGVGGTWGAIATGLWASKAVNPEGADGLFFGNPGQLWTQIVAILASYALAAVMTAVILKVVDAIVGLRVPEEDEVAGLDLSQLSETAYVLGGGSYSEFSGGGGAFTEAMRAAEAK